MNNINVLKKSKLILLLTTYGSAAFMIGFISVGFLILQTTATLPAAQSIKSVQLKVPLRVYSADGLLISEFGNERRKPTPIEDIPQALIDAILASEDDGFYQHRGIDISGLVRAALSNFRSGQTQQGASTITMQVARNFFLSREKTYLRKLREVLLAIKLEQILTKDEILSLYLNKIFLGHRAYGFGAAAAVYYGRELNELSLAETAMLAGLPKAPSTFNPLRNPQRAVIRRNYVLGRMLDLEKISEADFELASTAEVTAEKHGKNTQLDAPHIAEMVRAKLTEEFGEEAYWAGLNVYTTIEADKQSVATQALRAGLQAYDRRHGFRGPIAKIELDTPTYDPEFPHAASEYYEQILSEYPNSQEQRVALVIASEEQSALVVTREFGEIELLLKDSKWARRLLTANRKGEPVKAMTELVSPGDIVYIQPIEIEDSKESEDKQTAADESDANDDENVAADIVEDVPEHWRLSQIPNISGALISIEPRSGKILSLVGGYDFFLNKYNRAVQSIRQPGSNIKPFIYSASLNKGFTPATLISGAPIVMTDPTHGTVWRPENYSGKFFGPTRIREALSKSLNLVSIRLLRSIGIPYTREYLSRFGIDMQRFSPTLTMALGSGGVTPLEMLSAYGTLANTGYKVEPYFIDHVTDRNGEIIYRAKFPEYCDECYQQFLPQLPPEEELEDPLEIADTELSPEIEPVEEPVEIEAEVVVEEDEVELSYTAPRVMTQANNFLLVSMLKDVVRRGTARKALALGRQDLAGKTGTTNDYVDAWFSGFNSKMATTVWVGFDEPTTMGKGEAGSVAALPIWINYMRHALTGVPEDGTELPEYIEEGLVNRTTGQRTDELDPGAVPEYFPVDALLEYPMTELSLEQLQAIADENALLEAELEMGELAGDDLPNQFDSSAETVGNTSQNDLDLLGPDDQTPSEENLEAEIIAPRIIEEEEDTEGLF